MNQEIRIKLSAGLIAVAVIHALCLAGVFEGMHHLPKLANQQLGSTDVYLPAAEPPVGQLTGAIVPLQEAPPPVNATALSEKKQQGGCINCPQYPQRSQPYQPSYVQPTLAPVLPAARPAVQAPAQAVPQKKYQLAVFIGRDAKSQQLLQWINSHPKFVAMRATTDVQVYASGDLLYQRRYAEVIKPDQFPAVVLTDQTGGHIHAAGGPMLPRSADELYADCVEGHRMYIEAKRSAPATQSLVSNGAIKSKGYSWDDSITPGLQLIQQSQDCTDGFCRPGDRVRDVLFDDASTTKQAMFWLSNSELLMLIGACAIGFILWKRSQG